MKFEDFKLNGKNAFITSISSVMIMSILLVLIVIQKDYQNAEISNIGSRDYLQLNEVDCVVKFTPELAAIVRGGGGYEEELRDFQEMQKNGKLNLLTKYVKNGDTVIEVGAGVGITSIFLSKLLGTTGRLYAYEPNKDAFDYMKRNAALNGVEEIVNIRNIALSSVTKNVFQEEIMITNPALHSVRQKSEKRISSFDDDLPDLHNVKLILLNADGNELDILDGMKKMLTNSPGVLILVKCNKKLMSPDNVEMIKFVAKIKEQNFNIHTISENGSLENVKIEELSLIKHKYIALTR